MVQLFHKESFARIDLCSILGYRPYDKISCIVFVLLIK